MCSAEAGEHLNNQKCFANQFCNSFVGLVLWLFGIVFFLSILAHRLFSVLKFHSPVLELLVQVHAKKKN